LCSRGALIRDSTTVVPRTGSSARKCGSAMPVTNRCFELNFKHAYSSPLGLPDPFKNTKQMNYQDIFQVRFIDFFIK